MITIRNYSNIAIFCGQFGISLLHVIFSFYYVKVFLNIFHVGQYWFNVAQFLFMIWNAINDPLFGYIQDIGESWMTNRLKIFTYFGPLMSLSFLILWFPWSYKEDAPAYIEGLHLIVALFLYDAFFSCIGVAWSALFTESTRNHSRRVSGMKYAQFASLISSNIIAIIERFSHSLDNMYIFQIMSVCVAVLATLCFFVTAYFGKMDGVLTRNCQRQQVRKCVNDKSTLMDALTSDSDNEIIDKKPQLSLEEDVTKIRLNNSGLSQSSSWSEIVKVSREIVAAFDFWRVVFTNFIHTCRSVMHLNFAAIVVDLLIPQTILPKGSWQLGLFFALCSAIPQIIFIMNEKMLLRLGAYGVFMRGFYLSIFASCLLYFFAPGNPYIIIIFLIIDTIAVHATSPLFNILFAEFVEDDAQRNSRKRTMSSLIFSLNALIVKPSISVTPVIVVYFMNQNGYELVNCVLNLIFGTPLFLSLLEILTLRGYSLRTNYCTRHSKRARSLVQKL